MKKAPPKTEERLMQELLKGFEQDESELTLKCIGLC